MATIRGRVLVGFSILLWGVLATSCTVVTDPTKPSTDVTSSTSPGSSKSKSDEKAQAFTRENFARLKEDLALGQGEHLASLAAVLGVVEERRPEFFAWAKEQFPVLVRSEQTTSEELLAALDRELALRPDWRGGVTPHS